MADQDCAAAIEPRVTLRGAVIREIVAANPEGRLKAVEYDSFGGVRRVEWHDDPKDDRG